MNTIIDQQKDNQDFGITPCTYYLGTDPAFENGEITIIRVRHRQTGMTDFYQRLFVDGLKFDMFKPIPTIWEQNPPINPQPIP